MFSIELLKKYPEQYYKQLCELNNSNQNISDILNEQVYESWYGTHLHCLCCLVGKLEPKYDEEDCLLTGFYGYGYNISNELGIKILNEMIRGGIDINIKDYYDMTVNTKLNTNLLTTRVDNIPFKENIEKLYD